MSAKNKYGINDQQKRFLDYYRLDPELRIGYNYHKAYPTCQEGKSSRNAGSKLLATDGAQEYLTTISQEEQTIFNDGEGVRVTVDRIIEELKRSAFLDPAMLFNEHEQLKSIHDMEPWVRRAIGSFKIKRFIPTGKQDFEPHEIIEIKLLSKEKTLELLGRHLTMFTDKFMIETEEAMYERIYGEIRSKGEEAISMLVANYNRLKKINDSGKSVVRPTSRPSEQQAEIEANTTDTRDTTRYDGLI